MPTETTKTERSHSIFHRRAGSADDKEIAAITIQKNYRGYRARRQLNGLGLDASTRWSEALKELQYRQAMRPLSRDRESTNQNTHGNAMNLWRMAAEAVRHAASDDTSDTGGEEGMSPEELQAYKAKKAEAKRKLLESSKMMDLQYWLEMVDTKHRYGSNLRAYHLEWQRQDTHENFFYWLDHGGGKNLELPTISRERLENMQVRYLSREERQQYLVRVDAKGRLCWAKNGEPISTTTEFRDSIEGVVPVTSEMPTWSSPTKSGRPRSNHSWSTSSGSSSVVHSEGEPYATSEFTHAKGFQKLKRVSPAIILNKLLLKTIRPNTWIFVADTSFHLYVGIKQSGTFQHSSFLQGARISSAGLIKIKDGQLRKLSPLSGHYRTPTKNFRMFLKSLKDAGADMSHLSISRSYAVLLGLETYNKSRKVIKNGISHILHPGRKIPDPDEAQRRSTEFRSSKVKDGMSSLPDRTKDKSGEDVLNKPSEIVVQDMTKDSTIPVSSHDLPDIREEVSTEEISTGIIVDTSKQSTVPEKS